MRTADVITQTTRGMKAMRTNKPVIGTWTRRGIRLGVLGLLLAVMGDRGSATATRGIDPLDVLDLQVKPNVIVVLDSSGSMQETTGGTGTSSGDHPRSKLHLAKDVLNLVVANNA